MKKYISVRKISREIIQNIKGDNSWEILICAGGQGDILCD